jgi:branched-chain amino acid aminotransferase
MHALTELKIKLVFCAKALQYAVQLFEGLKAYRGRDGVIRLFRPDANIQRMRTSAARLALPDFDGDEFLRCLKKLVEVNRDWVGHCFLQI